ncbi:hypothetical protein AMTRI_Chr09g20430 [Amborella trichopoda]|uniref:Uncharacterized protein n=1 Tax=Amborella trichopoda TaxID=13333 RepID=U5D1N8_AMBTC|nr:YTH domain-containing protein 1 [Amborella trichopoda]ERN16349.1 hypothetical protein AMTR_s00182p00053870 [Amborella trichopoda]|eukprot:XP_006854882.1 YTH domain-containing protein 1 [Amborella trichopoda]
MDTPSSIRRVTRSQTRAALNSSSASKTGDNPPKFRNGSGRNGDRAALIDITNDSPIVGLALGLSKNQETPASSTKRRNPLKSIMKTPGSGEALLRCQVRSLLQRVEEEGSPFNVGSDNLPPLRLQSLFVSPSRLLAPTPANTPQVPNLSAEITGDNGIHLGSLSIGLAAKEEQEYQLSEVVDSLTQDSMVMDSHETPTITRALLFDSPGKQGDRYSISSSPHSVITCEEEICKQNKATMDDDSSEWSVEVHVSSPNGDLEEKEEDDEEEREEEEEEEKEDEGDGEREGKEIDDDLCAELCEELSKICVQENRRLPKPMGKHTRFIYNSNDEIEREEIVNQDADLNVLHLRGIPTPKGKHLRFPEDED